MTTLGSLFKDGKVPPAGPVLVTPAGRANGKAAVQALDLKSLVAALPGAQWASGAVLASMQAWTDQDDDAHEPCSLTACRTPLHPGPCKGWKHTLHSVSPHIYRQLEEERVRKANHRRLQRIAALKAANKPIPRKLLEEIKPKPAPTHPHGMTPVPLGQVNQKADLAGGQAHHAGQAVSNAAGIKPNTATLPKGPKQKKPTVAGRGPAFVITQPKVTDQYKLDKAAKITPAEWDALTPADKTAIRNELTAIKARGFGPQQTKADALLAKLPAANTLGTLKPGTPGTITTPSGHTYQKVSVAPGKVSLGQAVKPTPSSAPASAHAGSFSQATTALRIADAITGKVSTGDTQRIANQLESMKQAGPLDQQQKFRLLVDKMANAAMKRAVADKMPGLGHGTNDVGITEFNHQIRDHILEGRPGLPPVVQRMVDHHEKVTTPTPASVPAVTPATPSPPAAVKREPLKKGASGTPSPSTPAAPASPPGNTPAAPAVLSPDAQQARAVAGRGIGRPTSKLHVDTYGKLTKAEFDSLDDRTQRTIRDDLANAKAKFLDPKKQQQAQDLLDRFGSRHTSPAPGAPAVPTHPKGYSDPVAQAVAAAHGTNDAEALKRVGQLSHTQLDTLDAADKKTVTARLAFIAAHPKADPATKEKAQQLGRLIVTGKPAGMPKLDHEPTLNEIHAHQASTGFHAQTKALEAAADTAMPRADRVAALNGLSKAHFDDLNPQQQRRITDALQDVHHENSGYSKAHDAPSTMAGEAITKYTGDHPAVHRIKQAEADFRAGKTDARGVYHEFLHARVQAPGDGVQKQLEAEAQRIAEGNPAMPLWLRSTMIDNPYSSKHGNPYSVISQLSMEHSWKPAPRLSQSDFNDLFRSSDDDLKNTHPIHVEAIKKYREHVVHTGLEFGSPWSTATKNQLVDSLTGTGLGGNSPVVSDDRMKMIDDLPAGDQTLVRTVLADRILAQTSNRARAGTDITLRQLKGHTYTGDLLDAALASTDHFPSASTQDIYRKLDPQDFQSLSYYAQKSIGEQLDELQTRAERGGPVQTYDAQSNPLKVFPAALKDHLNGDRTDYADRRLRMASDVANYGQKIVNPYDRTRAYAGVPIGQFRNLSQTDQAVINNDLSAIAADAGNPLPIRYGALFTNDFTHGLAHNKINAPQLVAIGATDPRVGNGQPDHNVLLALGNLSKADYDALDKTYRDAIDLRVGTIQGPLRAGYEAKFHPQVAPAANPGGYTPTPQASVQPHVQAALDTIYGVHPKSHTMAHQLSTYGALRGSDFHQLNAQEQSHLLSDLSYIETTAKGPSAAKAKLLMDRFTPAGTPAGQVPPQPIIPPVNAVPGQVRYATPIKGLAKSSNPGKGGDRWITLPSGQRVWGEYGASGLLIKHTDPATGEERYLMVQRGPAISDPGKWTFPGGASESKETPHEGAARETIEELGLKDDVFKDALVHGDFTYTVPNHPWKYTSVAISVPSMIKPNLSTAHARAETSDAKWMTLAEIQALDAAGKLHHPIAGGKLEKNVISLYPPASSLGQVAARPGPVSKRLGRLKMPSGGRQAPANFNAWPHAHKPSKGKNLIPDKAAFDAQRQKIKQDRALYDGKTADGRLAAIGAQQGFDDTPTVVDKKEIDRLLATGDYIEAWRGVQGAGGHGWRGSNRSNGKSATQINEEMRTGPAYYGKGIFGNGYYLATQRRIAEQYADGTHGSVVRMLIPKTAVTDTYDKVEKEAHSRAGRTSKAKGSSGYEPSTFYDPGRYAAAKGLDGIEILPHTRNHLGQGAAHVAKHGSPAFNWLNRSVLIIQKEPG